MATSETETAEASPTEAVAEPVMIEIWRQQRQRQHAPRHHRHKPNPAAPTSAGAEAGSEAGQEQAPREARAGQNRPRHDGQASSGETREGRPQRTNEQRGSRPPRPDAKRGNGKSDDRRFGDRRQPESRGWQDPPKAAQDNKMPDPDSPFAKLLALKAELESKGKKG
jgi:ATP-dependent RNA helicase SUPV3L1/SUV3